MTVATMALTTQVFLMIPPKHIMAVHHLQNAGFWSGRSNTILTWTTSEA